MTTEDVKPRLCSVNGCDYYNTIEVFKGRHYCTNHYRRAVHLSSISDRVKCGHVGCDVVGIDHDDPFWCVDHRVECSIDRCYRVAHHRVNNDPYCDEHIGTVEPDESQTIECGAHGCKHSRTIACTCGSGHSWCTECYKVHMSSNPPCSFLWTEQVGSHPVVATISKVDHPSHYNTGDIEVVDAIMDWRLNFNLGCAVKHVARAGKKDPTKYIEDLGKAIRYLQYEIEWEKKHGTR